MSRCTILHLVAVLSALYCSSSSAQEPDPEGDEGPPTRWTPWQPPPPSMVQVDDDEPAPAPAPAPRGGGRSVTRVTVGGAARSLYDVGFWGAHLGVAWGGEGPRGAWYFTVDGFGGATDQRLATGHLQLGFLGEGIFGRFRIGAGQRNGLFMVRRATDGSAMLVLTFGPRLTASYDLATVGKTTVLVGADAGVDLVLVAASAMLEGNVYLGFRF